MLINKINLEVKLWGSIHNVKVLLEGNIINMWDYDRKKKISTRELIDYPIDEQLDVRIKTRGMNGSSAVLTIKFNGQIVGTID
ncbi:hypothetical protein ASE21_14890 [Flavobacterium sp. Root901]|uniref:hypothetical protein n=1 Tax=Flavobacterium sp. Root901 TaxID=1736605 RepID=UPI0007096668|nr:hypothetical protein [Flavobacterium sp. Root901]KRD09131.1 hypothetical protein ASE21_14890 [Flavobacterium sp. Root901]